MNIATYNILKGGAKRCYWQRLVGDYEVDLLFVQESYPHECFLPTELADRYFVTIRDECVWEQKPGIVGHVQPRLTASYGDEGVTYR